MGYTPDWENNARVIPEAALVIIRAIVDRAYAGGVIQRERNRQGLPVVTARVIRFNGVGERGYEAFRFAVDDADRSERGTPFAFCTTNRKPYDTVVMKALIALTWALDDLIAIRSDGRFGEEWADVRAEMRERYGIPAYGEEELIAAEREPKPGCPRPGANRRRFPPTPVRRRISGRE